jgi:hypothetical protein
VGQGDGELDDAVPLSHQRWLIGVEEESWEMRDICTIWRLLKGMMSKRIMLKGMLSTGGVSQTYHHYHPLKQKKSLRGSGEVN